MKVKFVPQNIVLEIKPNESVMHLAHNNNLHIQSVCKGLPSCAECRVRVIDGDYNVLPPSHTELSLIGTSYFVDGRRLSCQLRCFGDITVDLSEQEEKQERAVKKPRGKAVRASEDSRAVLGSMILEEAERKRPAGKAGPIAPVSRSPIGAESASQAQAAADATGIEATSPDTNGEALEDIADEVQVAPPPIENEDLIAPDDSMDFEEDDFLDSKTNSKALARALRDDEGDV